VCNRRARYGSPCDSPGLVPGFFCVQELAIAHADELVALLAVGRAHDDRVGDTFAEHRATERGVHADVLRGEPGLVGTDAAKVAAPAVHAAQLDPRAEAHLARVARLLIDDFESH